MSSLITHVYGLTAYSFTKSGTLTILCKMQFRILKLMKKGTKLNDVNFNYSHWNILHVKDLLKYSICVYCRNVFQSIKF
jgi:hypothetical protein